MVAGTPDIRRQTWDALLRAQARVLPRVHRALHTATGLSLSEFTVLAQIACVADGLATMSALHDQACMSAAGITRVVGSLEEQGLVSRIRDRDDRRLVHAALTANGRRRLREATVTLDAELSAVLDGQLSDAELALLARVLENLGNSAGSYPPTSG
jgi:DNA-binding MarR family transcriptional regulator